MKLKGSLWIYNDAKQYLMAGAVDDLEHRKHVILIQKPGQPDQILVSNT